MIFQTRSPAERELQKQAREAADRKKLLLQFESLGENCELGFVQEHLGAHPLGLFRWSGIQIDQLVVALDTNLAGIGDPEHTEIYADGSSGEYFVQDARYGMPTHTRLFNKDYDLGEVQKLLGVRSRRLRENCSTTLPKRRRSLSFSQPRP